MNKENKPSYVSGSYESVYSPSRTPLSPNHEARTVGTPTTMTSATVTPASVNPATAIQAKGDYEAYLSNWRKTSTSG